MALNLDDLTTPLSRETLKKEIYDLAQTLGLKVNDFVSGSPIRTLFSVASWIFQALHTLVVDANKAAFLDTATGNGLTSRAKGVYGVERITDDYAVGAVALTNIGGGIYSWAPGDLVLKSSSSGTTYANLEAISLGALGTATANFQAQVIGSAGSASAGQIDTLVTTALGVTCSNAGALSGRDAETDEALRERCRDSLGSLSPSGPKRAIEFVCSTPSLVSDVVVNRVKVLQPNGDGICQIYVAAPDGGLSGPDVAKVQLGVDYFATAEVQTNVVHSATDRAVDVAPTVYVTSGVLSDSEWQDEVTDALDAYLNGLPIGGVTAGASNIIPWRALVGVVKQIQIADSFPVISCNLASEVDISLVETEVAVPGTYTITIVQVS
ncbi:MAG: baseplate J/gp47 family protein [Polyangiaceae bacterium]|nr:baseplate J/gp47 family protein [Polyangiaceae bacterium]